MNPPLLRTRGLDKRFGALVAASAITLEVQGGERVSLIGSNGAGKTTFVNMITGYLKPDAGCIELAGEDVTLRSPRAIAKLGVARSFQIPQLYPTLTVLENMLVAIACHAGQVSFLRAARQSHAIERRISRAH